MQTQPSDLDFLLRGLQATALTYKSRLADRIVQLSAVFAEDYDGRTLSARSLAGLIDFLESSPSAGYPDLTLTPTGDIRSGLHRRTAEARLLPLFNNRVQRTD